MASERSQFPVEIKCPGCGQEGTMTWEEDDGHSAGPRGRRTLVRIAKGFHKEAVRTKSGDLMVVCDVCGTIQED